MRVEFSATRDGLRAEIRDGDEETRRHTRVLYEDLKGDIQLVAEHLARVLRRLDDSSSGR